MALSVDKEIKKKRGGKRIGSGRPPGRKDNKTLEKEAVLRVVEQRYMRATDSIVNARLSLARGQQFLFRIDKEEVKGPKGGTSYRSLPPKLVTAEWEIQSYLEGMISEGDHENENDPSAAYYYITTKEPVNAAIDSIENRVFGKPTESLAVDVTVKFSLRGLKERRKILELPRSDVKILDA